ncbi:cell division protein FtsQ/DivIB [Niabella beijingensis]|uniref:cell division protein FtsQ/DivIB n=1 Tax=Niabella beijingensis TaxID=2872700 RepID=UPI001CBC1444|nr:cell division protein FtsQ/DivIB [Niabella beijingensis]MBZ4190341.1 cell division protein FtsQ/DivIB [Niabella beijingensis]
MLLTLMWLGVGAGMFTLVVAAMRVQDDSNCKGYEISIRGAENGSLFTSKEQIVKLLKQASAGPVTGQRKSGFNLPRIEDLLEQSSWVYNAELYFDNKDILRVNVTERKPLARVFSNDGQSFYIDEAGKQIPLSDKISLDVPVFTGYPNRKVMNAADSALLENMIATASFINSDSFWVAQVSQIDIHKCGSDCWDMEMVPVVGNHRVDLGDGSDIASKFHRLYLFYDQVLKRTGFDKYQRIDVQYGGQVVGVKGRYSKLDSLQLRKNIEELLQQSRKANDLIEVAQVVPNIRMIQADTSADARMLYEKPAGEDGMDTLALMSVGDKPEQPVAAALNGGNDEKKEATAKDPVKKEVKKTEEKSPAKKEAGKSTASAKNTVATTKKSSSGKPQAKTDDKKKQVSKAATAKKTTKPAVTKRRETEKKSASKKAPVKKNN